MSYDHWKTTNPADAYLDDEDEERGECDCCGKWRPLSRCWAPGGLETFACDECQGDPA